jgi:hypothetical protein
MGAVTVTVKAHPAHQPAHRSEVGKATFHTTFPNSKCEKCEKPHSKPHFQIPMFGKPEIW